MSNFKPTDVAKSRKRKYGTLATVFTVMFIIAAIVVNFFIGVLTDRYVLEIDMTSNDMYEISEDTKEVLMDLEEPITITVLAEETTYEATELLSRIREVLKRYSALSGGLITVDYVNPTLNPAVYDRFNTLGDLASNDIIIESARRFKHLTPTELYDIETDSSTGTQYLVGLRAEQKLTSGILYVTASKVPQAAYVIGHGETTNLEELSSRLTSGNYEVTRIDLGTIAEVPEDIDMLIISAPTSDYTDAEINVIDAFLDRGGNIIVSMSTETVSTLTNLERYFEEWGVRYERSVVMDNEMCLSGYPTYIVPDIVAVEGITDNLASNSYMVIPGARRMTQVFETNNWRSTQVLFSSSAYSYAKSFDELVTVYEKDEDDADGPFPLGILAAEAHIASDLETYYSSILFVNAGMISDSVLELDNYLNSRYIVSAINFLNQDSDTVIIESKTLTSSTLSLTGGQMSTLFWVMLIIIPVGCLALGLTVWLRRRHL